MGNSRLTYGLISKYRKALMGISILSILFFHFLQDCHKVNNQIFEIFRIYYLNIHSSAVDIFFILSGFGLYYSFRRSTSIDIFQFYKRRYIRLLVPYFLLAAPAWLWRIIAESRSFSDYVSEISFVSFFTKEPGWFWFIFAIGIMYLIFPRLYSVVDTAVDSISAKYRIIILFCLMMILNIVMFLCAESLFNRYNIFTMRIFPFIYGIYLGRLAYEKKRISFSKIAICCCSIIPMFFLSYKNELALRVLRAFLNCSVFLGIIILFEYFPVKLIKKTVLKVFEWLGDYTLELYLTHMAIRKILIFYGFQMYRIRYELLMLAISFVLSIILKKSSNVIIKRLQ